MDIALVGQLQALFNYYSKKLNVCLKLPRVIITSFIFSSSRIKIDSPETSSFLSKKNRNIHPRPMRWMFCFRSNSVNSVFFWNLFRWCYTACFCWFVVVINIIWDGWSMDVQYKYKLFSILSLLQMNQAFITLTIEIGLFFFFSLESIFKMNQTNVELFTLDARNLPQRIKWMHLRYLNIYLVPN